MSIISVETKRIYKVSSKELREIYHIEGEITDVGLWRGRNSFMEKDPEKYPPDEDVWFIETKETKEGG
jgi:hypothetical protein